MSWAEYIKFEHELPERPSKKECQKIYVYKKGEVLCCCMYGDLPSQKSFQKPDDVDSSEWTSDEIVEYLEEQGCILEYELQEDMLERITTTYSEALQEALTGIRLELCGEKYFGIQDDITTQVLFHLACQQCRDWKEGYHHYKFREEVSLKFEGFCLLMRGWLKPLPGCFIHNSKMEGTRYIFSHWTELDIHNTASFKSRVNEFLSEEKHTPEDRKAIARLYYQAAMEEESLDFLPEELIKLADIEDQQERTVTIYVDNLQEYPLDSIKKAARKFGNKWCHMATNGEIEDLHQFAESIGLKRSFFQNRPNFPHYDLVPSARQKAVDAGAIEVSGREIILKCRNPPLRRKDNDSDD